MSMSDEEKKPVSEALRDWGIDVDRFNERAKESLRSARGDLSEVTGTLRHALLQAKEVVMGLQSAGSPAAAELKQGFERAWSEIERAFQAARQQARNAQQSASGDAAPSGEVTPSRLDREEPRE
jgi:hypothetical protein